MSQVNTILEILQSNTESFAQLRSEIIQNAHGFIKLFINPNFQNSVSDDPKMFHIVMKMLVLFFEHLKFDEETLDSTILPIASFYLLSPSAKNHRTDVAKITNILFKILNKLNKYSYACNLFLNLNKSVEENIFVNTKAYVVYYAYQNRNYTQISELLNNFNIELVSSHYNDHVDYCMFQFYRGLIALSQRNLFKASVFFICVLKVRLGGGLFHAYQVESVRRLILLSYLVDSNLRKSINDNLNNYKILNSIKPVSIYDEFQKLLTSKSSSYKELSKFYKEHKGSFLQHKTKGLVKLCLKEFVYNKLTESLKTYKRIKIEKLSTMLEIDRNELILNLKQFAIRNKLNVKVNEASNTIEVFEEDFDEKIAVNELKTIYSNLNELQIEMVDFAFKKSYSIAKKIQKAMKAGEVMTGILGKDIEVMDEDD